MELDLKKPSLSLRKPVLELVRKTRAYDGSPYKQEPDAKGKPQYVKRPLATAKASQMASTMS